ncbi:MAG TPA: dihydrodipicolinate reductase C-terminal domain-containing protein [Gemmatimonadaceae bacterium]|jgi:4-hydroxy-tetrahydrodipicolinate reductase
MTKRLALIGMGKMGKALAELAPQRGWELVAALDEAHVQSGITREMLNGADVAIEFSVPEAAPKNIRQIVAAGIPVVVGTTGWYGEFDSVKRDVEANGGALLTAPNFSVGVNIFEQIVAFASRLLATAPGFEAHIIETHHSAKKDAPSGTANTLGKTASAAYGKAIPITSVRVGAVPGTHELIFDAPFEQIHLEHIARDRRVFAEGALVAAAWLIGKRGVFGMNDVLGGAG